MRGRKREYAGTLLGEIIDSLGDGILIVDSSLVVVAVNARAVAITGMDPALARKGTSMRDIVLAMARAGEFGPCDPERETERRLRNHWRPQPYARERVRPDGRSIELRRSPLSDGGTVTIYVDTTDRRRTAERLRELNAGLENEVRRRTGELLSSERRFADLVANIHDALIRDDLDGRLVYANRRFLEWFGLQDRALRDIAIEDYVAPEWRTRLREQHDRRIRGEAAQQRFEFEGIAADGHRIWLDVQVAPVAEDGRITGTQSVIRDITAYKRAQARILELNAELEGRVRERTADLADAVSEIESFSYSVSHDLRAPVRAVTSYSQILLEEHGALLPADARRMLGRIAEGGERMSEMIDGLLELGRIGRRAIARRRVDLARIAREVWDDLRGRHPGRTVAFELREGMVADGDPALVRCLLRNLLDNAWKHTRGRSAPCIAFGAESLPAETAYFVSDNGIGFDMAHARNLFEPFHRLHRAPEFEGSGIGLAIVRRIVQRHGGRIWAEAERGSGATFRFTLAPAAAPDA